MKKRTFSRKVLGIAGAFLLSGTMLLLNGCMTRPVSPFVPYIGDTFSAVAFPVDIKYEKTPIADSYGASTAHNVLGLVAWGDASVTGAAAQGDLDTVNYVDASYMNILFIYSQTRIEVAGQGGKYKTRMDSIQALKGE